MSRIADPAPDRTITVRGILPPGAPDLVYLPVDVPRGVREIAVSYAYEKPPVPPGTQGNALDIGIFDERGTDPGGRGFRGWSGGARNGFRIRADEATPGYLAGPVRPGTWHIALGPYTVAPGEIATHAANKYLGVLVAAKYARVLNEFPRDRSSSREKKLTTRSLEELAKGDIVYHVVPRRRSE